MSTEGAEVKQDYASSLEELTFNSRPIITSLTDIAQESIDYAKEISEAIREYIEKCAPTRKLPALYLLDSVSKNVGSPYTLFFNRDLFRLFTETYTLVTDPIRQKMYELFLTWKEPSPVTGEPLFGEETMRRIDSFLSVARGKQMQVQQEEMNRRQLEQQQRFQEQQMRTAKYPSGPTMFPMNNGNPNLMFQASLLVEVDKLIDMTSRRKALDVGDPDADKQLAILSQLKTVLSSQGMSPEVTQSIQSQLNNFMKMETEKLSRLGANSINYGAQQNYSASFGLPPQSNAQDFLAGIDLARIPGLAPQPQRGESFLPNSLISSLQNAGLISRVTVELTHASLQKPRPELIENLYSNLSNQCGTCGKRFPDNEEGKRTRQAHLDWHFRVNKKLREDRGQSRCWYLPREEWINYKDEDEVYGLPAEDAGHESKENGEPQKKKETLEEIQKRFIIAPSDKSHASLPCPICLEKFSSVWNDKVENWVWMNAEKYKGKIVHATCLSETRESGGDILKHLGGEKRATASSADSGNNGGTTAFNKKAGSTLLASNIDLATILANAKRKRVEDTESGPIDKKIKAESEVKEEPKLTEAPEEHTV